MNTTVTGGASRIHALSDGTAGRVHAYLLQDDDGLTLIDTLSADDGSEVLRALARIGKGVTDLRRTCERCAWVSTIRRRSVTPLPIRASARSTSLPSSADRVSMSVSPSSSWSR